MKNLFYVVDQFTTVGRIKLIEPFGSGHINDSDLVETIPESSRDYALQKINHHIFKNVPQLMNSIMLVTTHI